jgi:hypothetical protein
MDYVSALLYPKRKKTTLETAGGIIKDITVAGLLIGTGMTLHWYYTKHHGQLLHDEMHRTDDDKIKDTFEHDPVTEALVNTIRKFTSASQTLSGSIQVSANDVPIESTEWNNDASITLEEHDDLCGLLQNATMSDNEHPFDCDLRSHD